MITLESMRKAAADKREQKREAKRARDRDYRKNWVKQNEEHVKTYMTEWRNSNKHHLAAYDRKSSLKRLYGITEEEYDTILKVQNGMCKICGSEPKNSTRGRLHVDHDHKTGQIRGLLCGNCNVAIGKAKDNVSLLIKMAHYLNEHARRRSN